MSEAILVPLDGSELAEQALDLVITVAGRLSAEVHLVRVPVWPPGSPLASEEDVTRYLEEAAGRVSSRLPTAVRTAILPEQPEEADTWPASARSIAEHVLEYAGRHGVGMLVLATHGRGGLSRAWFGSVAEAMIRRAAIPVLVYRPEDGAAPSPAIRHILVPLDASDESRPAIQPAMRIARAFGARITLLRVIPWPYQVYDTFMPATVVATGEDLAAARTHATEKLEALAAPLREAGLDVAVETIEDVSPGRAIVAFAEDEAVDMVALATHARRGFDRLILGSVADKVVRGAGCPVLLVRSAEDEEEKER